MCYNIFRNQTKARRFMDPQFPLYPLLLFISAFLALFVGLVLWGRRHLPGGRQLALMMLCAAGWCITGGVEATITGVPAKIFWSQLSYLFIPHTVPLFFVFVLAFSGQSHLIRKPLLVMLWAIPAGMTLLALTNPLHGLIWADIRPIAGSSMIEYVKGTGFWVCVGYLYALLTVGCFLLVRKTLATRHIYRRQAALMLASVPFPWLGNFIYISGIGPTGIDLTPIGFTLGGLLIFWNISSLQLLDLVPVGRDAVLDSMQDGMLVLDRENRVIDFNPAARQLLGIRASSLIGLSLRELIPSLSSVDFSAIPRKGMFLDLKPELPGGRYLNVRINPFHDPTFGQAGSILVIRDVTQQILTEAAESDQRQLAEALRETAAMLNSTLDYEQVLDRVMENVIRVMPHDAASIMFLDSQRQHAVIARYHDEFNHSRGAIIRGLKLEVSRARNLSTMLATNQPLAIADVRGFDGWVMLTPNDWIRSSLGAPIRAGGEIIGFLVLYSATPNTFQPYQTARLQAFADQAAMAIENARLFQRVQALAATDPLTGLLNRRQFFHLAQQEVERAVRYRRPLALIMMDLDHFKDVNDSYGHIAGDIVLEELGKLFRSSLRKIDLAGRYGGEEFIFLVPEASLESARQLAERIKEDIAERAFHTPENVVRITASSGVTALTEDRSTLEALINAADQALYAAKAAGKNQVAVCE